MNFAFATILLIFISLPGIAIRRSYYTSKFSSSYISTNWVNELIWSFIPAVFIHAFAIILIEQSSSFYFNIEYIGYLLMGGNEKININIIFQNIHSNIVNILKYFLLITLISSFLGHLSRILIRRTGLDIIWKTIRFPNKWHYLFTGEYLDIEKGWKYHLKIDFITIDVLVTIGDQNIIYSGLLEDYYLSKTKEGLDQIIIKYPSKKIFSHDGESEYREIPGNYLIIPYQNIVNLNVQYYNISDQNELDQGNSNYTEYSKIDSEDLK